MDYNTIMYRGKVYILTDDAFERLMETPVPESNQDKACVLYTLLREEGYDVAPPEES